MAARSLWKGAVPLNDRLFMQVEAVKATDSYEGHESLKQCCSCHVQPLKQVRTCSVTGDPAAMVMAAERDGGFVEIPKARLDKITELISSPEIQPLALRPRSSIPIEAISELWYLRPSNKILGSVPLVGAFLQFLEKKELVMYAKFAMKGRQHTVVIYPCNGALAMNRLRYVQETRPLDEELQAPGLIETPEEAFGELEKIMKDIPTEFNLNDVQDDSVKLRQEAIEAAIAGAPLPAPVEEKAAAPIPDLMAALKGAVDPAHDFALKS